MRITALASVTAIALTATIGVVSASAQSTTPHAVTTVPMAPAESVSAFAQSTTPDAVTTVPMAPAESVSAFAQFATLDGITAVPMARGELDAVKGLHIHFLDAAGGFRRVGQGNVTLTFDNDSPDNVATGRLVHPGYHGLCVAGPIVIPPGGNGLSQC